MMEEMISKQLKAVSFHLSGRNEESYQKLREVSVFPYHGEVLEELACFITL
jgi:hypothetical protein